MAKKKVLKKFFLEPFTPSSLWEDIFKDPKSRFHLLQDFTSLNFPLPPPPLSTTHSLLKVLVTPPPFHHPKCLLRNRYLSPSATNLTPFVSST